MEGIDGTKDKTFTTFQIYCLLAEVTVEIFFSLYSCDFQKSFNTIYGSRSAGYFFGCISFSTPCCIENYLKESNLEALPSS